jgi:hypothetical protein
VSESNANQPVTERLCQERQKHVQAIQEELKEINSKLDDMNSTLTELSTDSRNHFDGHEKGWNKGLAIIMCLIALCAIIISLISLRAAINNSTQAGPGKISYLQTIPKESRIVHYQQPYSTETRL